MSVVSGGEGGPRPSPARTLQLLEVARRFYLETESRVTIAEDMGLSRFRVARLLQEARALGFVRITIAPPQELDYERSQQLVTTTGLRRAIVIPTPDPAVLTQAIAEAAASYLTENLGGEDVLGLLAGRTITMMVDSLTTLPACTIVQTAGVSSSSFFTHNPTETIQRLAQLTSGPAFPIYAPLLLDTPAVVEQLRHQDGIAEAWSKFPELTKVIFSIGAWEEGGSSLYALPSPQERHALEEAGAVAEVMYYLFDAQGQRIGHDLTARCLTVPFDDLLDTRDRIALGGGAGRYEAVLACVRSGVASTLITDSETAQYLLDHWA